MRRFDSACAAAVAVLHQVGVFGRVFVEVAQDRHGAEAALSEEELRGQVRLADFQHDAACGAGCESLLTSLSTIWRADAEAADVGGDGEVEDVEPRLVQLVDHEADDPLAVLGDHADAIALAEAAEEVFLAPGELEAGLLDVQRLRACRGGSSSGCGRGAGAWLEASYQPPC